MDDRRRRVGGREVRVERAVDERALRDWRYSLRLTPTRFLVVVARLLFLERLGDRLPLRVGEDQLDLLLHFLEPLVAEAREADAFLEELQRLVERQLLSLEALHDLLELLERFLELVRTAGGHCARVIPDAAEQGPCRRTPIACAAAIS